MPLRHCERGQSSSSETAPELFRRFASRHDGVLVPAAALLFLCLTSFAFAFNFPALTGRVVDQADVIQSGTKSDIEEMLKNLEDKSGIQLVVATVKSLEGSDIETYANQLFRTWKLGEAKKNNGVLLLVAPAEHKVRIEVGYGLEGTLTDALSSVLISSDIVPRFKTGDFSSGIERGVDGIISILNGELGGVAAKGGGPLGRSFQQRTDPHLVCRDLHHHPYFHDRPKPAGRPRCHPQWNARVCDRFQFVRLVKLEQQQRFIEQQLVG